MIWHSCSILLYSQIVTHFYGFYTFYFCVWVDVCIMFQSILYISRNRYSFLKMRFLLQKMKEIRTFLASKMDQMSYKLLNCFGNSILCSTQWSIIIFNLANGPRNLKTRQKWQEKEENQFLVPFFSNRKKYKKKERIVLFL